MHETAIVSGLMKILTEQAALHGVARIARVNLKVGRLRGVDPRQLRACFELFAEETLADGAELVVDEVGVRGRCRACGCDFDVPRYRFECPECKGRDIAVLSGQELYIDSFEVAGEPTDGAGPNERRH